MTAPPRKCWRSMNSDWSRLRGSACGQSLERTLGQPCPHCAGSGLVKSAFTVCCEIYTEVRKMVSELEGRQVALRVNPEVGKALKARDNTILSEIEEMLGKPVVVRNNPNLHIESFAFE